MSNTIIRIEHPYTGIGIFRNTGRLSICKKGFKRLIKRHTDNFAAPRNDTFKDGFKCFYILDNNYFCAFKSVEQVKKWITNNEMKRLIKLGYEVLMIEVSECHEGVFQIIYDKANIINTTDITDIFYKDENNVENI